MKKNADNGAKALLDRIEETAFFTHYSLLGEGNIRQYDWEKLCAKLTGLEQRLWKFFLLGEALTRVEAVKLLGEPALKFLLRHKICAPADGKLSLGINRLIRFWGMTFFIERGVSAPSFIGDDTKALLAILPNLTRGRCLSLFTAGGFEVMPLAAGSGVEINFAGIKASEGILNANLELNAAEESPRSWEFSRNGKGTYDLIVSNPPSLFEPAGVKLPKFAAGGTDGLKCVRKFLEAARKELKPGGLAITTFGFFAEVDSQTMEQRLRALLDPYGLNYVVAVSSKLLMESGVPVFNQLIATAMSVPNPPDLETVMRKTIRHIQRHKFAAVHLLKGRFWKNADKKPLEQQITNYSDSYYGTWTI
jgi:methylase of polypeptide subunit release factors